MLRKSLFARSNAISKLVLSRTRASWYDEPPSYCKNITFAKPGEIFEPFFEETSEIPSHQNVNFRLRGYDYQLLEKYQSYVHRVIKKMGGKVTNSWATPAKTMDVKLFGSGKETDGPSRYRLANYERTLQMAQVSSLLLPLLLDVIATHLPQGVTLTVKPHQQYDEDIRYIPDNELKNLRKELKELDDPNVRRKLMWDHEPLPNPEV